MIPVKKSIRENYECQKAEYVPITKIPSLKASK